MTRETLVQNFEVLALAIKYVGTRVSVPACQVHVGELYSWMNVRAPSNLMELSCLSHLMVFCGGPKYFMPS